MRLTRAIFLLITIMLASSDIIAENIVLAPASTTVNPGHSAYPRIESLAELQQESDLRNGFFEVHVYPGVYADIDAITLSNVAIRGVYWPTLLPAPLDDYNATNSAIISAHIELDEAGIISGVVVDTRGDGLNLPTITAEGACTTSRIYGNIILGDDIGIYSNPPSNSTDDDPYLIAGNIIAGHEVGIYLGDGHRSGYDSANGSISSYSVVSRNQLLDNQTGMYFSEGADSSLGINRYEGLNYFDGNVYHIVLKRDPLSSPLLMPAIGNEWYDSGGSPITTTNALEPYIRIEDSGGSPFGVLEDYIDTGLPSSRPSNPKNPQKLDFTIEPRQTTRINKR